MKKLILLILIFSLLGCKSEPKNIETNNFVPVTDKSPDSIFAQDYTQLKDTVNIKGNYILILRPDSIRFQSYLNSGKEWIYEVDSDFGFGVSTALDSFNVNGITESITDKRFVKISDCKNCPTIIDRDTLDYGVILTGENKEVKVDDNVFGSEYYIDLFKNYFK